MHTTQPVYGPFLSFLSLFIQWPVLPIVLGNLTCHVLFIRLIVPCLQLGLPESNIVIIPLVDGTELMVFYFSRSVPNVCVCVCVGGALRYTLILTRQGYRPAHTRPPVI